MQGSRDEGTKLLLFVTPEKHGMQGNLFKEEYNRNGLHDKYLELKRVLEAEGYGLHTADERPLEEAHKIFFHGLNVLDPYLRKVLKDITLKRKSVALLAEPPVVNKYQYLPSLHKGFHKIYTWNDDLVDGDQYLKLNFPFSNHEHLHVPFSEKRFISLISGNKISFHKDELYSLRYRFIRHCERNSIPIDHYGVGWNEPNSLKQTAITLLWHLRFLKVPSIHAGFLRYYLTGSPRTTTYKGKAPDKYKILSECKFNVCFENQKNIKGWISEKILDCFIAGTVPVYYGASNVSEHIPKGCFIDLRDFKNFRELTSYLKNMDESTYETYLENARAFMRSKDAHQFTIEYFIEQLRKSL